MPATTKKKSELDVLLEEINEKFTPEGAVKPVIARASEMSAIEYVPCTSPVLGHVLSSGGWPKGKLIEVFGKEGSGKTTLMNLGLLDCLEQSTDREVVGVIDVEHRYNKEWAKNLGLIEDANLIISQPATAEDAADILSKLLRSKLFAAIGFDSIAGALPSEYTTEYSDGKKRMARLAEIMGKITTNSAADGNLFDTTVIFTNQLRADMDGFHRPMTPGGHAVKHGMSVRIYLRPGRDKFEVKVKGEEREVVGKNTNVTKVQVGFSMIFTVVKNTFGPSPRTGFSNFYYEPSEWYNGVGFDIESDLARLGPAYGIVERNGVWYEWDGIKGQGSDKFFEAVEESGRLDDLYRAVRDRIGSGPLNIPVEDGDPIPVGPDIEDPDV